MSDEISADDAPRDLLGDPILEDEERRGRPAFKVTDENQRLVSVLKAAGWPEVRIARRIGCDPKTLRKYFSPELEAAADRLEAEALLAIADRMREGNVSAARQVLQMTEKGRAAPPAPGPGAGDEAAEPVQEVLGKKAQKVKAAQNPPSGWGSLLPGTRPN